MSRATDAETDEPTVREAWEHLAETYDADDPVGKLARQRLQELSVPETDRRTS